MKNFLLCFCAGGWIGLGVQRLTGMPDRPELVMPYAFVGLMALLSMLIGYFTRKPDRAELYHAAIANARKQGLLVPSVIAAVDEANFPQEGK